MPPPELWDRSPPASVSQIVLTDSLPDPPVVRLAAPRAELAHKLALARQHGNAGDSRAEREAWVAVFRVLVARATEWDTAVLAARRALSLDEDAALYAELGGMLAGLGEPALAAASFRGISPKAADAAAHRLQIAVLLARAGDSAGAADALREAAAADPTDALPWELLATLASWAPDDVGVAEAVAAYREAAERRTATGDTEGALEDRLRAFELAPADASAAEGLIAALAESGPADAADEARRAHAAALGSADPHGALLVHEARMRRAVEEGNSSRAIAALLDAWLDGDVGGELAEEVDAVLLRAGLPEVVASRLWLYADERTGEARSLGLVALARFLQGAIPAAVDRMKGAWVEALVADPRQPDPLAALERIAAEDRDHGPLVEALVRVGLAAPEAYSEPNQHAAQVAALETLAHVAEEKIADPELALWATERIAALPGGRRDEARAARLAPRVHLQRDASEQARAALDRTSDPTERAAMLRKVIRFYRGKPEEADVHFWLAAEWTRLAPKDPDARIEVERAAARSNAWAAFTKFLRERIEGVVDFVSSQDESEPTQVRGSGGAQATERPDDEALAWDRLRYCQILRHAGEEPAALAELLAAPSPTDALLGAALVLASRLRAVKERAEILAALAPSRDPQTAAALLCVAADLLLVEGEEDRALSFAERAILLDGNAGRSLVSRAATCLGRPDRESVAAVEQAATRVMPRGIFCDALAAALEALGEADLSAAWTERWVALNPVAPDAAAALLRRASAAGDPARLVDAIDRVLAEPRPIADLVPALSSALDALGGLDPGAALEAARRAIDVLGPRPEVLRRRLVKLGDHLDDAALVTLAWERWLASSALAAENPLRPEDAAALSMKLAAWRASHRDAPLRQAGEERPSAATIAARRDGEIAAAARHFARAAQQGHDPASILAEVEPLIALVEGRLGETVQANAGGLSDALLGLYEARARSLAASGGERTHDAAFALRTWAGAIWDLARDEEEAEAAFFQAATLTPSGPECYARDLRDFAGALGAVDAIVSRANALASEAEEAAQTAEPGEIVDGRERLRASLLIQAAGLAASQNQHERALACAATAIDLDPSRADALALVERSAHVDGGLDALDRAYDRLARAALGRYGRRAAHYRGARQFERRGAQELALRHAIDSFEAVPAEGTTFALLCRLAERAADPAEAVRCLQRVAEASSSELRASWLRRAAAITGTAEEGLRTRFDIYLRVLLTSPSLRSVTDVAAAMRDLVEATGDEEAVMLRVERAARTLLPKLDGPDGARTGTALARLAIETLGDLPLAFAAIDRAMAADGDVEELGDIVDLLPALASAGDDARRFVADVLLAASKPYASVGPALLRMTSQLATMLGDPFTAAALLVAAVKRAPEDDELIQFTDQAVVAAGDDLLADQLERAVPAPARIEALCRLAEERERNGQEAAAIALVQRALDLGPESAEHRERLVAWLRRLFAMSSKTDAIESLLRSELDRGDLRGAARVRYGRDLGAIRSGRGHHQEALTIVTQALVGAPADEASLSDLRRFGRRGRDPLAVATSLDLLLASARDDASRALIQAEIEALAGEAPPAPRDMEAPPSIARVALDAEVLEGLEQEANERGDHQAVADLLAQRIALASVPDVRRMLRLRRAAVLEQRLGKLQEASQELSAQLVETPEDVIALRYLADMRERASDVIGAAALWEQLTTIAPSSDEKAEYGLRTVTNFIAGGDLVSARKTLDRIGALAPRENVVELRAEIARAEGDHQALAGALDQLAGSSRESPQRRSELLVEAARAAAAAGDDAGALDRARRAQRLAPDFAEAVLEVMRAEYRVRGAGTPREAQAAATELQRIVDRVPPALVDLHAFLLAEELDVIQGGGAGMRELQRRHAEVGLMPLLALGMAERLVRQRHYAEAVPFFEASLDSDLRGLRAKGRVALAAGEAAAQAGQTDRALALLQIAAADPDTRPLATRREQEIKGLGTETSQAAPPSSAWSAAIEPIPPESIPTTWKSRASVPPPPAIPPLPAVPGGSTQRGAAPSSAAIALETSSTEAAPTVTSVTIASDDPATPTLSIHLTEELDPPDLLEEVSTSSDDAEPPPPDEATLRRELMAGSFDAGEALLALYADDPATHTRDVLAVRRQQAALRCGDLVALAQLHEAATQDGAAGYATAIEHVLNMWDSGGGAAPPPLASQRSAPELVASLLFRHVDSVVNEALAIVWETGLYRREPAAYGLTGVARVQPGLGTPLGEMYASLLRLFGLGRIGVFHDRKPGPFHVRVALLAAPCVVLTGELPEDQLELAYRFGAHLVGAMPEHALVNGMPEDELQTLIDAVLAAFGPLDAAPRGNRAVVRLEQSLWQLIPPRAERRLREICAHPGALSLRAAVGSTRLAMRRAGLFASGSLSTALRMLAEEGVASLDALKAQPDGLAHACATIPEVADLVKLAIRSEYAEARWVPPRADGGGERRSRLF